VSAQALDGGFADPVLGAQTAFRAIMDALANPGVPQELTRVATASGLSSELAAVALTLCDHDTQLWLDPSLGGNAAIVAWLRFQTGAPLTGDPASAAFALVSDMAALPAFDRFGLGTAEYPDRSTTVTLALPSLRHGPVLTLRGPGIKDARTIAPTGLPHDFLAQWLANRALFPRGIDLLLVGGGQVIGLPRTTRISLEA
jgi:alpha-D-ribose 1-methylphosphonate 5-triphosphate synthase subunit PhnH